MTISAATLDAIDILHLRYVIALDGRDMNAWLATFSEEPDSSYICVSEENERRNLPLALMLDDCRTRLQDRVTFVTKIWDGTYQPYRTRHFVQRLSCKSQEGDVYAVTSSFLITMIQDNSASRILSTGLYEDLIRVSSGGAQFKQRRAVYDANVLPQYVVFPL